jgi:hypothetical protein
MASWDQSPAVDQTEPGLGGRMDKMLRKRRGDLEERWLAGARGTSPSAATRALVASSWQRSSLSVPTDLPVAPVSEPEDVVARWSDSRFGKATRLILDDLTDLAAQGNLVAAITDEEVTIAWTAGGRQMARKADLVHFAPGGRWSEEAVGTNALALARLTGRPESVFSAEHFAAMVHDWVCYSAPILDPHTGTFLGVIDISTVWSQANPALLTTVSALARCVEYELATDRSTLPVGDSRPRPAVPSPRVPVREGLVLRSHGSVEVVVDGVTVHVSPRQFELLTILALHPEGLSLDELTCFAHGDQPVQPATVKAELSHLRSRLGGRIGSRPYRLVGPVTADVVELVDALAAGDVPLAVDRYRGPLLPMSDAPELSEWRTRIDVAVRDAVIRLGDPDLLFELSGRCPYDAALHRAALAAMPVDDLRSSVLAGRIEASA